jgi:hypothetical protein
MYRLSDTADGLTGLVQACATYDLRVTPDQTEAIAFSGGDKRQSGRIEGTGRLDAGWNVLPLNI